MKFGRFLKIGVPTISSVALVTTGAIVATSCSSENNIPPQIAAATKLSEKMYLMCEWAKTNGLALSGTSFGEIKINGSSLQKIINDKVDEFNKNNKTFLEQAVEDKNLMLKATFSSSTKTGSNSSANLNKLKFSFGTSGNGQVQLQIYETNIFSWFEIELKGNSTLPTIEKDNSLQASQVQQPSK